MNQLQFQRTRRVLRSNRSALQLMRDYRLAKAGKSWRAMTEARRQLSILGGDARQYENYLVALGRQTNG